MMPRAKRATATAKPAREPVVRQTVYLGLELADRLDRVQAELRVLAGERRAKVTANSTIEAALALALADFESNKEASALAQAMARKIAS